MPENNFLDKFIKKADIASLPVLSHTLQMLKTALEKPSFNYRHLDNILKFDPACMINLLSYANQEMNKDFDNQISQVEHAAMFLGMERLEKFIDNVGSLYSIKNKAIAQKLANLQHRGVHAAFQAQAFAQLNNDNDSAISEIYTSTLVTPLSELICWHIEPIKAQKVELLVFNKGQDYEQAQRDIFGFSYHELAEALTHHWHIPSLFLQRQTMQVLEDAPRTVKCMYLAEKCSIIAEQGWYHEGMYEHIQLCADTLHYSDAHISHLLHTTAVNMAHTAAEFYPVQNSTSYLPLLAGKVPYTQVIDIPSKTKKIPPTNKKPKSTNSTPVHHKKVSTPSIQLISSANDLATLIRLTMDALFETKQFNRVAFLMLSKDKKHLQPRSIKGYKNKHFNETVLAMQPDNLFTKLLAKPQSIFINQLNYQKFSPFINKNMQKMLDVQEFIARAIHVKNKPIGLFYMDKHPIENNVPQPMDIEGFNQMKKIMLLFDRQLKTIG